MTTGVTRGNLFSRRHEAPSLFRGTYRYVCVLGEDPKPPLCPDEQEICPFLFGSETGVSRLRGVPGPALQLELGGEREKKVGDIEEGWSWR